MREFRNHVFENGIALCFAFASFFIMAFLPVQSEARDTLRILFVGNSHTYVGNIPHLVSIMANSRKIALETKKSVKGGASLKNHWLGEMGLQTRRIISDGAFDFVVLQDKSASPIETPDTLLKYAGLFCDLIREYGGEPLLFNTWAKQNLLHFQGVVDSVYSLAGKENMCKVVPVGQAWETAGRLKPGIPLYKSDNNHSAELGVYLTSCVFFIIFTGESAENLITSFALTDIDGETVFLLSVPKEEASFLQKTADSVVGGFLNSP
jgi:hypothetical protein